MSEIRTDLADTFHSFQLSSHSCPQTGTISDSYTIHGGILEEVKSAKYLALNVDNKLNFNTHAMFMLLLRRPTQLLLFLDATYTTTAGK